MQSERIIRLASPGDWELALLPRLIERLASQAPGMTLVVRPSDFRGVPGLLDSGEAAWCKDLVRATVSELRRSAAGDAPTSSRSDR